jgi:hypothetical protein
MFEGKTSKANAYEILASRMCWRFFRIFRRKEGERPGFFSSGPGSRAKKKLFLGGFKDESKKNRSVKMKRISITLALLLIVSDSCNVEGCTTILVGKRATADGSVLHGTMKTWALRQWGGLVCTAASHEQGKKIQVPYVALDLPASTLRYWHREMPTFVRLGIASETRPYDSVLVGMNELVSP